MKQYVLLKTIDGKGQVGDKIYLSDKEFAKFPKNVSLMLIKESEETKKDVDEIEKDKEAFKLYDKLVQEIGFSVERAKKVCAKFSNEKELVKNLNKLPFSKVENDTLKSYYEKVKPKRVKDKQKMEDKR